MDVQVLDALVVNCGYPVHLALSKKDLLNKLVYRFPPSSDHQLDQAHSFTLQLLQKWCIALCEKSKHRADFGNIRLMHSLLKSRGFPFPRIDPVDVNAIIGHEREDVQLLSVQTPGHPLYQALKTKEEVLMEQRIVHEAKLEDLLRKGTPADLKAANELMQVMSGYVRLEDQRRQLTCSLILPIIRPTFRLQADFPCQRRNASFWKQCSGTPIRLNTKSMTRFRRWLKS